jgi:hypothetical protein
MAPRRPALYPDQWPLVLATAVVLLLSIGLVLWVVFGR